MSCEWGAYLGWLIAGWFVAEQWKTKRKLQQVTRHMILKYKNYTAKVALQESGILYGTVLNLGNDVVTFQTTNPEELQQEFEISINDYLAFCEAEKQLPVSREN